MKKRPIIIVLIIFLILSFLGGFVFRYQIIAFIDNLRPIGPGGLVFDDNSSPYPPASQDVSPLPLFTTVNYDNIYGDTPGTYQVLCEVKTEGLILYSTEYANLQKALQINNENALADSREFHSFANSNIDNYYDYGTPWYYDNNIDIVRADSNIVSFRRNINSYAGGPHGSYYADCYNYNSKSGSLIGIDTIIKEMDTFLETLENYISTEYADADLSSNWRELLYSQTPYYEYLLTDTGLSVIFNQGAIAVYAVGPISMNFDYAEYKSLFSEDYTNPIPQSIWDITDYKNYPVPNVDIDGDGKDEYLRIQYPQDYFENYRNYEGYTVDIWFGNSETEAEERLVTIYVVLDIEKVYLVKTPGGKHYLFVETSEYNDWHSLEIIDLTDPAGGPYLPEQSTAGIALYGYRPLNTNCIYGTTRTAVMGTSEIFRPYIFTEAGTFEPLADEYEYTYEHIYFDALFNSSLGLPYRYDTKWQPNPVILNKDYGPGFPKGTPITRYKTDAEFYVTFINEDKQELTLRYTPEEANSYPRTIDGILEEDILQNVIYAG